MFTDRASDRGHATKYGITLATLSAFRGRPCTAEDVQGLQESEARACYKKMFVTDPGFDKIEDDGLQELMVDWGVNSGPGAAIRHLQVCVGAAVDGVLGPDTLSAIQHIGVEEAYSRAAKQRMRVYIQIVLADPAVRAFRKANPTTQLENLLGWVNRGLEFL